MSTPGSPRLPYADLPAAFRARIDGVLGSPVVGVEPRSGGFSPGPAAVVTGADGRRAFVKAAGTSLNPDTPALLRTEAGVAAALPANLPVPRLLGSVDDGEWVALLFEEVRGTCPELPWTAATAAPVLKAVARFADLATPCPAPGLPPMSDRAEAWADGAFARDPEPDPWIALRSDRLAGAVERLAARGGLAGDTLVHLDLRSDNVLVTPDRAVVLLDWPWACTGPAWADPVLLALDMAVHGGLDPAALVADLPAVRSADPRDVTDLLVVLLGMWGKRMVQPPPPGLPTLRAFQRRFHGATLDWVRRRADAGPW